MRHSSWLFSPLLLGAVLAAGSSDVVELEAISDEGWEGSLEKRGFSNSKVHLQEYEHFVWGSPAGADRTVYVNMTMNTNDDELILSMERFASQLTSVNCSEELMEMTFKSNETYQHAIESWEWVNFSKNRTFILIANYPGCGKDKSRDPWVVDSVHYDPSCLRVELNSTKKTWEEVAHTYTLDFGHYAPPESVSQESSVDKRWTFDKSFPLDLNHQMPPSIIKSHEDEFYLDIECPNCGTTGQLVLAGHVEMHFFGGLKTFEISATPYGIGAALNLDITMSGKLPDWTGIGKNIDLLDISLGGFSIPGILDMGPNFKIQAGIGMESLTGSATFSTRTSASISDSSVAKIDLTGHTEKDISGWVPSVVTEPSTVDSEFEAVIDIYIKTLISASVMVLGNGFTVLLGLKLPDLVFDITDRHISTGGGCPGSTKENGVELDISIGAVLAIQGYASVVGVAIPFLNYPLYEGTFYTFAPMCFPFGDDAPPIISPPASIPTISYPSYPSDPSVVSALPASETYGGSTDTYGGAAQTYGGASDPYGGASDPYGGATDTYGGATDTYGGATATYSGATETSRTTTRYGTGSAASPTSVKLTISYSPVPTSQVGYYGGAPFVNQTYVSSVPYNSGTTRTALSGTSSVTQIGILVTSTVKYGQTKPTETHEHPEATETYGSPKATTTVAPVGEEHGYGVHYDGDTTVMSTVELTTTVTADCQEATPAPSIAHYRRHKRNFKFHEK